MTNDERGIFDPDTGFQASCHLCDWQSSISNGPDMAQHERFDHVNEQHPDASINWWADAPAVEIVENTEGEDE